MVNSRAQMSDVSNASSERDIVRPTANNYKGPTTPKDLMKAAQAEVRRFPLAKSKRGMKTSEDGRNAIEPTFGVIFDRLYRSYVYDRLRHMGFKEVRFEHGKRGDPDFETIDIVYPGTQVDAEDVYQVFRRKFMESIILGFNFDSARVGRGAFRNYVKLTLQTILIDILDLVEKKDRFGNVVYTNEPRRHKNGKIMHDDEGNILYKPVMIPRCVANQNEVDRSTTGSQQGDEAPSVSPLDERRKEDAVRIYVPAQSGGCGTTEKIDVQKYVLRLAMVAYVLSLHDMRKHERQVWRSETIDAIFGRFEGDQTVMNDLIERGVINGRNNFDNIKCLFHKIWYENWWRMWSKIATGPKVIVINGKLKGRDKKQRSFVWHALKPDDEIATFVSEKERESKRTCGANCLSDLKKNYETFLEQLVEMEELSQQEEK